MSEIRKPMNPNAEADFAEAIKEAAKQMSRLPLTVNDVPDIPFKDIRRGYCGAMRLDYLNGRGAWQDVLFILLAHGYEVTAKVEDATETEKQLDGINQWVVIEYREVG